MHRLIHLFLFALLLALLCSCAAPAPTATPALSGGEGPTLTATFTPLLPTLSPTPKAPAESFETPTPTATATATATPMSPEMATQQAEKNSFEQTHPTTYVDDYYGLGQAEITPIYLPGVPDITQDVLNHPERYPIDQRIATLSIADSGHPTVFPDDIGQWETAVVRPVRLTNYQINHVTIQRPDDSTVDTNEAFFTFVYRTPSGKFATLTVPRRAVFFTQTAAMPLTPDSLAENLKVGEIYGLRFNHVNYTDEVNVQKLVDFLIPRFQGSDITYADFSGEPFTIAEINQAFQNPKGGKVELPFDRVSFFTLISLEYANK